MASSHRLHDLIIGGGDKQARTEWQQALQGSTLNMHQVMRLNQSMRLNQIKQASQQSSASTTHQSVVTPYNNNRSCINLRNDGGLQSPKSPTSNRTASHSRPCSRSGGSDLQSQTSTTFKRSASHCDVRLRSHSESRSPLSMAGGAVTSASSAALVLTAAPGAPLHHQSSASSHASLELDMGVALQLKGMGFPVAGIREAAQKLGNHYSIDQLLDELQAKSPNAQLPSVPLLGSSSSSSEPSCAATVSEELEQMGFAPNVIALTLARLGATASVADALKSLCREPDSPVPFTDSWECQICFEGQYVYGWHCPEGHRFCTACMRQHVKAVGFPRCPQEKCTYELTTPDLHLLKVSRARVEAFEQNKLQAAIGALGTESRCETVIHCKRDGCPNVVLVPRRGRRERFACPCGAPPFCTQCGETPYHYHADCTKVKDLRQRWLEMVSEVRASRKKQLEAQRLLRERCERDIALKQDEAWKSIHCKLCPHCERVVEKLEGCDQMRCGVDVHGGNKQQGCGQVFDWKTAKPYVNQSPVKTVKNMELAQANWSKGLLHPGVPCEVCKRDILGPRLRCIHCENFNVCTACEYELDNHDLSHVFETILQADYDWNTSRLFPPGLTVRISRNGNALPPKWYGKQFDGVVCQIICVVAEPGFAGYEPGMPKPNSTTYKVKIKGHRGTHPEMPIEHLVPLFTSRLELKRFLQGRPLDDPESDPEEDARWIGIWRQLR